MLNKERILEVMISYGKQVDYPDRIGPKEFLQKHLNNCFKVLLMKKLVKPEHYDAYRKMAIVEYQKWWLINK
jgi:hypothetical protein